MYKIDSLTPSHINYSALTPTTTLESSKKVHQCLSQKDFDTVLRDPDLFWLSFCKSFFHHQNKNYDVNFFVTIENEEIRYSGLNDAMKELRKTIEKIRQCLIDGLNNRKNVTILQTCYSFFPSNYLFTPENVSNDSPTEFKIAKDWYESFIKHVLPDFLENCGATYIHEQTEDLARSRIQIHWKDMLVYPIPCKTMLEPRPIGEALYPLYQKQEHCDFSISCMDGTLIKTHSALLYAYGGSVLQKLVISDFKESKDRVVTFETHSTDIVKNFLDFIYLGGKKFLEKMTLSRDLDITKLYELFDFAHMYGVETLMDCCTNLISLQATKEDIGEIKELANLYNNEHLKQLADHFYPQQNNPIKV